MNGKGRDGGTVEGKDRLSKVEIRPELRRRVKPSQCSLERKQKLRKKMRDCIYDHTTQAVDGSGFSPDELVCIGIFHVPNKCAATNAAPFAYYAGNINACDPLLGAVSRFPAPP
jgi:hypothetical protein